MSRVSFVIAALVLFYGCATSVNRVPEGPQAYRNGYAAGCNSGYVAAGHPYYKFTKDVKAYDEDKTYKQGWDDGFAVCKGKYESIDRAMRR